MVLLMSWAPECRYPAVLEVPVQIDATAFQLKRMAQLTTSRTSEGQCVESLATVYDPDDFHYVSRATTLVMHLPTGPVAWPPEALKLAASRRPPSAAPHEIPEGFKELPGQIIMMAGRGRAQEARERAEALARFYVARPPSESLQFFAALAMARRQTNDLAGAATAYGVATLIAAAANDSSALAGVVYDNLATVRRLQGQYPEATTASDRALEILAAAEPKGRAHGGALNNRATLLADQGRYQDAVAYSDRALTILKEVLNSKELAPFLKDNALFREKAAGR